MFDAKGETKRRAGSTSFGWFLIAVSVLLIVQAYGETRIGDIGRDKIGQSVAISGTLETFSPSSSDTVPYSLFINDGSGTIRLIIWQPVYKGIADTLRLKPGVTVTASGLVQENRGEIQLNLVDAKSITVTGSSGAARDATSPSAESAQKHEIPVVPCRSVTREIKGQRVCVRGKVVSFMPSWKPTAPNILTLSDDTGAVDVVYWRNTAVKLPPSLQEPKQGFRVEAKGSVDEYQGNIQIRVTATEDIRELIADEEKKEVVVVGAQHVADPERGAVPVQTRGTPRPASQRGESAESRPPISPAPLRSEASPSVSAFVSTPVPAVKEIAQNPLREASPKESRGVQASPSPSPAKGGPNPFDTSQMASSQAAKAPTLPVGQTGPRATAAPTPGEGARSEIGAQHAVPVSPIPLSSITKQMKGKQVVVEGTVKNVIKVREDDLLMVDDGSARVYVPIWEWVKKLLPAEKQPQLGNTICVRGLVHFPKDYDYAMIVVTSAEDVIRVGK